MQFIQGVEPLLPVHVERKLTVVTCLMQSASRSKTVK